MANPDSLEDQITAFWRDPQDTLWDYSYSVDEDACQADSEGHEDRPIGSENDDQYNNLSFDDQNHDLGAKTPWMWNEVSCTVDSQATLLRDPLFNVDNSKWAHEYPSSLAIPTPYIMGEHSLATSSELLPPTSGPSQHATISQIADTPKRNTNAGSSRVNKSGGVKKPKRGGNDPWVLEDKIDNARSKYAALLAEKREARPLCNSLMGISDVNTTDQPPPPGTSKQSLDPGDTELAGKSLLTALTNRNSQIRSEIRMIKLQIDIRTRNHRSSGGSTAIQKY